MNPPPVIDIATGSKLRPHMGVALARACGIITDRTHDQLIIYIKIVITGTINMMKVKVKRIAGIINQGERINPVDRKTGRVIEIIVALPRNRAG
jgi:hypothetical protein